MARILIVAVAAFLIGVTLGWRGLLGALIGLLIAGASAGGGRRADTHR